MESLYPTSTVQGLPGLSHPVRGRLLLMVHASIIVVGVMLFQARLWAGGTMANQIGLASVVLLLLCVWMVVSWRAVNGTLFDPYGLFVLSAIPFHAGYSILRLLGKDDAVLAGAGISDSVLGTTLLLVCASMAGMHFGALLYRSLESPSGKPHAVRSLDGELRLVGWLLLALAIVPTVLEFRGYLDAVMTGGYSEVFLERRRTAGGSASAVLLNLITPFFVPAVMFLLAGSRTSRAGRWISILAITGYALAYLFIGFRAYAFFPLIAAMWVWHVSIRPLPLKVFAPLGAMLFLVVAPLVRTFRGLAGSDRFSLEAILSAYASVENPVVRLIGELGGSMFTISYTAELVPAVRPHEWGLGYARALLNAVPILDIPNAYGDSGVWLAWEIRPDWAAGGFAYGYSYIAEAFLNFGYLGGPLVLIFLGVALAAAARWALQSRVRVAFIASFLPILLFFVRGESVNLARPILWYALIPFTLVHLLAHYRRRIAVLE